MNEPVCCDRKPGGNVLRFSSGKILASGPSSTVSKRMTNFPHILVLGATGRLGKMLRAYWQDPAVCWQSRHPQDGPDWLCCDIDDNSVELAQAAESADVILCLAGVVPGSADPVDFGQNISLALTTLRLAQKSGSRVLLVSTAAVYGAACGDLTEDMPVHPISPYGQSKRDMEVKALELAAHLGVRVSIFRLGNVIGADAIVGGWGPGFELDQFASGATPARSYIGPRTLAQVFYALAKRADLAPIINVAAPGCVQMGDLLNAAKLEWSPRPAPDTALPRVHLQTDRLLSYLHLPDHAGTAESLVEEWTDWVSRTET